MKRILRALRLDKIAAVDRPCQEGAVATIIKRAETVDDLDYETLCKRKFTAEERRQAAASGAAMRDGSYPIENTADLENAIHAVGRGSGSHAAIRAHIMRRARALGASDKIPDDWKTGAKVRKVIHDAIAKSGIGLDDPDGDEGAKEFDEVLDEQQLTQTFWDSFYRGTSALQNSLTSILKDDAVADKSPLITQSLQEFADYIESILPGDVGKSLAAGIAAIAGSAGPTLQGDTMSDAVKKALGLAATATDADVTAALAKRNEDVKKLESELAIAKMSEKHKAFINKGGKMPEGGKDKFASMTAAERDKHIEDNPVDGDGDEDCEKALKKGLAFKTADGIVIHKRDFKTDAAFELAKSQAKTIADQSAAIAKAAEEKAAAEFAKRATDLGFGADFGPTLRKAYGGDAAAQAEVEKRITALQKQVEEGALFGTFGKSSPQAGSAEAEFAAKVAEVKKANPKLSDEQAYTKAYTDPANTEIKKRMKAEARA